MLYYFIVILNFHFFLAIKNINFDFIILFAEHYYVFARDDMIKSELCWKIENILFCMK